MHSGYFDMEWESMAHMTSAQQEKVAKVMREFHHGDLEDSHGKKVTDERQAKAIAMSEAGASNKK